MKNGKIGLSRTKKITFTAMLIALAVSLRIIKYSMFGPLQFVNFPAIFTIVGGVVFGPIVGLTVGLSSYLLSDMVLGAGPWTVVNAVFIGGVGIITGLIWGRRPFHKIKKIELGIGVYLLMLGFDIFNSWALNIIWGYPWLWSLIYGILGLFMPAGGGYMIGVGPITEATTTVLTVSIVFVLARSRINLNHKI
jgi:energy-coupling factor transport system substrate-specific component